MAVDRIDAQIQSLISGAQLETAKQISETDGEEAARKAVERRRAAKKTLEKSQDQARSSVVHERVSQARRGDFGPDVQRGLSAWENASDLQGRLSDAQRRMFHDGLAKNPGQTAKAGEAMARMAGQPGFEKAVSNAAQLSTLQEGLIAQPQTERRMADVLRGRFMQSPKADAQAKNKWLAHNFKRAQKEKSTARADDLLGSLAKSGVDRLAQRSSTNMVVRKPDDTDAMDNLDTFAHSEEVLSLPKEARSRAVELLAKASGKKEVADGFELLIVDPRYGAQTAANQGRFFSTIGSGRPNDYREITDKTLEALRHEAFPKRSSQVKGFLRRMSAKLTQAGAAGVDVEELLERSRQADQPALPVFEDKAGLNEEQAVQAKARDMGQVVSFFNAVEKRFAQDERALSNAKYMEDLHALGDLASLPALNTDGLDADTMALIAEKTTKLQQRQADMRLTLRKKSRQLRTKRIKPATRRRRLAARRAMGRQPKYFVPGQRSNVAGSESVRHAVGADFSAQIASAVSGLGDSMSPRQVAQVAKNIANVVANEFVRQFQSKTSVAPPLEMSTAQPTTAPRTQGRTDGWGVQRTFERDLGYQTPVMKPNIVEQPPRH